MSGSGRGLCENSDVQLACRTSISISSMWESIVLTTSFGRRQLRKQFCAFFAKRVFTQPGSKTEVSGLARHVRFTLRSRYRQPAPACLLVPNSEVPEAGNLVRISSEKGRKRRLGQPAALGQLRALRISRIAAAIFCGNLNRRAVAAMVFAWRRPSPGAERCSIRFEDFNLERVARRNIAGMSRTAVSTGTGRQSSKQIDLREKLDEVTGADGTCLHEILVRVLREP